MKKIILSLAFFFMLLGFRTASANVIINEVQISPTDSRFIELYNSSNSDIDLTDWYIQRKTETGNEFTSLVSKTNFENKTISSNGYFLISRNSINGADIVLSNLTLTNSNSIQIKNAEQEIVDSIVLGDNIPNPGENKSIQKTSSGWVVATPTPGGSNEGEENSDLSNDISDDIKKKIETKKEKTVEAPSIKAKILANSLAFTGQPLKLKTSVLGYSNENVVLGKVYWNFGDGKSLEQINNFEEFNHIYYYPGEYALVLEYYQDKFSKIPDVVSRMTVKVLPTTVVISKIGDMKDFFVELTNSGNSDIDISNWYLKANGKFFIFPKNSIILSKKQMTISGLTTGFIYGDQYDLKLFSATNELIFNYNNQSLQENNTENIKVVRRNENNFPQEKNITENFSEIELMRDDEIAEDNLGASPVLVEESGVDTLKNQNKSYLFFWGFVVLLVVSSGAIYYIRQNKNNKNEGEDFEILDE